MVDIERTAVDTTAWCIGVLVGQGQTIKHAVVARQRLEEIAAEADAHREAMDLLREARELLPHAAFAGWRHDERNGLVKRIDAALGGQ